MAAAAQKSRATRNARLELLGRPARLHIAIAIGKANHAVSICDVQELRVITRRIKRKSERLVQATIGECLARFSVAAPNDLDLVGAAFGDEISPFGAPSRNRGSRKPIANMSILNPGGTCNSAPAGRSTIRGGLIASALFPGGGRSATRFSRSEEHTSELQ